MNQDITKDLSEIKVFLKEYDKRQAIELDNLDEMDRFLEGYELPKLTKEQMI